jgi:hypothetical protein
MDKFNLEDMNNELSRLLNLQSESYDKQRLGTIIQLRKEIMNIKEQTNKIEIARKVAKKMIEVSMFILISFSMFGQPIFSGKKVHQLPAISTNQFDSTWLTILGNPSTGTLYKLPLDSFTISGYDTSKVTNSRLAKMPLYTVKGNPTNVTADPVDINISGMIQLLGLQSVALTAEYADLLHTPSQFNPIAGTNMAVTGSFPNITFTNTLDTTSLSNRINLKLNKSDTSTLSNRINLKANIASPTFTGTVTLPSSTSIGTVSQDEIGFLDGVPDNLVTLLAAKQNTLVSGTNLKTVNGSTLLGTGDITFTAGFAWGNAIGNIFNQTDLKDSLALKQKVLVSGTDIKTINGSSLVGSGNVTLITQSPLDSVLLYGNATDTSIVFDNKTSQNYTFIKVNPLSTNINQLPLNFIRSATDQGSLPKNEVFVFGFNLNGGGGRDIANRPSIGESWESNYLQGDTLNRLIEKHEIYYPNNSSGSQIRLSSYTINSGNNSGSGSGFIDYYNTVNNHYYKNPSNGNEWLRLEPYSILFSDKDGSADNIKFFMDTVNEYFTISNQGAGSINTLNIEGFTDIKFGNPSTVTGLNISTTKANTFTFQNSTHNTTYISNSYYQGSGYDRVTTTMQSNDGNYILHKLTTYSGGLYPTYSIEVGSGTTDMLYAGFTNLKILMPVSFANANPDASAQVDIPSTTKGFLPPRHTTTQMNAVSSPATGLSVYNTDATMGLNYNGSAWKSIGVVSGSKTATGTATTTFTVTFGGTQPSTSYYVNITPTNALSAALFYVTNKTTTTFDVTYLSGLTGAVAFDWSLTN